MTKPQQKVIRGDCIKRMLELGPETIDIAITSPPYNIGIKYNQYADNLDQDSYLRWIESVFNELYRILSPNASLFLNVGFTNALPWLPMDIANVLRNKWRLQNSIIWAKSISIQDRTFGHFKPINSNRFLNQNYEHLFHFTKSGRVAVDRLAIGVPFSDKTNIKRFGHKTDKRCNGNVWLIPYETIQNQDSRGHPCIFPEELARRCILLHGIGPNTIVIDPFLGSGTTLVACKKLGVAGIGIDIDKTYCKFAEDRIINS